MMARKRGSHSPEMTAARRKRLDARSQFALPGRRYPIDTPNRARNALARAAQMASSGHLSKADLSKVRHRVASKYHSIHVSGIRKK